MVTRKKWVLLGLGGACLVAVLASLAWYSWYRLSTSPLRLALPRGSTDVADMYVDMWPDYSYFLKAKLPSTKAFAQYCTDMNLTPHSEQRSYSDNMTWLSWSSLEPIVWWKPSSSLSGTFVRQSGHEWTMAKYEDGYLYVHSFSH